jgi:hypothetical protein
VVESLERFHAGSSRDGVAHARFGGLAAAGFGDAVKGDLRAITDQLSGVRAIDILYDRILVPC